MMQKGMIRMANEDFDLTQKTLLGLLGQNLFSLPFSPDLNTDWESVLDESAAQSVLILAFKNYRDFPLDEQLADRIQKAIRMKTIMNLNCFKSHTYLTKLMEENHIS